MANIRSLKKDIDYLTGQLVMDCLMSIHLSEVSNKESAYDIIGDVLILRNELRNRTNHPDGKDNKAIVKSFYHQIGKDLVEGCDKGYEKLGKLMEQGS